MGEIKSTLDLVMERTKGMAISEDEKRELRRKEVLQKVKGLSNRYREGQISSDEVTGEIKRMEEKTGMQVREILLGDWISGLMLTDEGVRVFEGIERLKACSLNHIQQRFSDLLSQYKIERDKGKQLAQARLTERLREEGIAGSAVEPNPERSDLWEENLKRLDLLHGEELEKIKNELRRS